jgi:hypothetical protein
MSNYKGELEVFVDTGNGYESISKDNNIVVKGMGYTIASLMTANEDTPLINFKPTYFQLGVSSVDFSSVNTSAYFYDVSTGISLDQYGSDLDTEVYSLYPLISENFNSTPSFTTSAARYLAEIPEERITFSNNDQLRIQILLEKNMAPNISIREVGLYSRNPIEEFKINKPILIAYKAFQKTLEKTQQVKLKFEWSIKLVDV